MSANGKCDFCFGDPTEDMYTDDVLCVGVSPCGYLVIDSGKYRGTDAEIKINFCPMCGRKLKEEQK